MPQSETLAHTLRDRLPSYGPETGMRAGACGCCTVIMDGRAVTSCMVLTMDCDGSSITTIEGLADPETGTLTGLSAGFCGQLRIPVRILHIGHYYDSQGPVR